MENIQKSQNKAVIRLVIVFILSILIYNGNASDKYPSGDVVSTSMLPFSIVYHQDFYLGRYLFNPDQPMPYYLNLRPSNGDYVSASPIGSALTALPFYLPYILSGGNPSYEKGIVLGKISASFIAAFSILLFYFLLTKVGINKKLSILFSLIFAFGSQVFSIASQGLWQHGSVVFWTIIFLIMLVNIMNQHENINRSSYGLGATLGMLLLTRPITIVILSPFLLVLLKKQYRKEIFRVVIGFIPFLIINMIYNQVYFGSSTTSGYGESSDLITYFGFPLFWGIAGNLFSPSKGLLVYMPWVIFAFMWLWYLKDKNFYRSIYFFGLLAILIHIIFYSKFFQWPAGFCFGPRYMTDIIPVLGLLSAGFASTIMEKISESKRKILVVLLVSFFSWASFVQFLGTYVTKAEAWNQAAYPDNFFEPLWSIKGSQIAFHLNTLYAQFKTPEAVSEPNIEISDINLFEKRFLYEEGVKLDSFKPNQIYYGYATIKNNSTNTLPAYESRKGTMAVHFAYSIWQEDKMLDPEGMRSALLHSVKPGESIKVYFKFRTPETPGKYDYYFTLVQEHVMWFSGGGPSSKNVGHISIKVSD